MCNSQQNPLTIYMVYLFLFGNILANDKGFFLIKQDTRNMNSMIITLQGNEYCKDRRLGNYLILKM